MCIESILGSSYTDRSTDRLVGQGGTDIPEHTYDDDFAFFWMAFIGYTRICHTSLRESETG